MDCYKYGYKYGSLAKRSKLDPPIILPTKVSLVQCNVQLSDYLRYLYWAEFSQSYCHIFGRCVHEQIKPEVSKYK